MFTVGTSGWQGGRPTPFLCGGERVPQPGMAPAEGGWRAPASRGISQPEQRIGGARVLARTGQVENTEQVLGRLGPRSPSTSVAGLLMHDKDGLKYLYLP